MPNNQATVNIQVAGGADIRRLSTAIENLNANMRELIPSIRGMSRALNQSSTAMKRTAAQAITASKSFRTYASRVNMATRSTQQFGRQSANTMGASGALAGRLGVLGQTAGLLPGPMGAAAMGMQQVSFSAALAKSNSLSLGNVIKTTIIPAMLTLGTGAAIAGGVQKFASLEKQMVRTARSAGRVGDNVSDLIDRLRGLSQAAPLASMNEAADATLKLARSGVSLNKAFGEAGEAVLAFAEVIDVPVQQAVTELQAIVNQTGRSMADMADLVVFASRETQVSINQISQAMARGSKAAKQMGLSAEQVGAIAAAATRAGLSGREAGTSLRSMARFALRLGTAMETAQQKTAIAELGIRDAVEAFKSGETTILGLIEAAEEAGATASEMGGIFGRSGQKLSIALRGNLDLVRQLTRDMSDMEGASRETADFLADTFAGKVEDLGNAFDQLLTQIGMLTDQGGFIGWLEEAVTNMAKLAEEIQRVQDNLQKIDNNTMRNIAFAFSQLGLLLKDLVVLQREILDLLGIITREFVKAGDTGEKAMENWVFTLNVVIDLFGRLILLVRTAMTSVRALGKSIEVLFFDALRRISNWSIESIFEGLANGFITLVERTVESIVNVAVKGINKFLDEVNKIPGVDLGNVGEINVDAGDLDISVPDILPEFPGADTKFRNKRAEFRDLADKLQSQVERLTAPLGTRPDRDQDQGISRDEAFEIFNEFREKITLPTDSLLDLQEKVDETSENLDKANANLKDFGRALLSRASQIADRIVPGSGDVVSGVISAVQGHMTGNIQQMATGIIDTILGLIDLVGQFRQDFIDSQKKTAARTSVPAGVFGQVEPPKDASAATGGTVKREGLVRLHRGEQVVPAGQGGGTNVNATVNLTVNSSGDPKQTRDEVSQTIPLIRDELTREVRRIMSQEMGRGAIRREGMEGTA